ncbi:unnamed protein product [Trichobilharzia regenti]|nr:unnamed protein product [Trichobilharzia regenti]
MGPDQIAVNYCDDEYTQSTVNPGYTEFDTITQSSNTHEIGGSEWCQQSVYSTTPIHGVAQSMTNTNETQLMPGSDPCQVDYDIWTTTVNEAATPLHLQPSTAYTPQQHQQVQYFNTYNEIFDDSQNQLIDNEQFNDKSTDYIDFILNSSMNQSTPIGNCCLNQSNYQIQSKMIDHFSDDLDAEPTNEKEACSVQFKSNLSTHSANNNNNWSNQCLSHTSFLSETDRNEENHVDRREENEKSSESMMHPSTSNSSIGSMNSQNYEFNELGSHFYPQNIYQPMNRTQFSLKNTLCSSNNNNSSTHTNQPVTIDYWISTE